MIKLNGNDINGFDGRTAAELLAAFNYKTSLVAVEYNGEILPKNKYEQTALKDGDVVEVVSFVGGG